jgi:hypothetical protein
MVDKDTLVSRIFLRSALPLVKVLAEEEPLYQKIFPQKGVIQFSAKGHVRSAAYIQFTDGILDVVQGMHEKPDLQLVFKTLGDMNAFFAGKTALPGIIGIRKIHLLIRILPLLLGLKILMPNAQPKTPEKRALKVKLLLFMVSNALSQLNKGGDPDFMKITKNSPDRIFQWSVDNGPAAYLRVKNGKSKAGRGMYTRRRPFVHIKFRDNDSAYKVLTMQVDLVDAVRDGLVATDGPPEASKDISLHMQRIQDMTTM